MGDKLISVGTRHVKIWRPEKNVSATSSSRFGTPERLSDSPSKYGSPSRKLSGRNCLLGSLLDKSFTKVVPISFDKAVVCSSEGDICLVHDNDISPSFRKAEDCHFGINSAAILHGKSLLVGGKGGQIRYLELSNLLGDEWMAEAAADSDGSSCKRVTEGADIIAMAQLGDQLVIVDSQRSVQVVEPYLGRNQRLENNQVIHRFNVHGAAVLGITAYHTEALPSSAFLTYSANGSVRIWSRSAQCVKEMTVASNEEIAPDEEDVAIRVVKGLPRSACLVVGDTFGTLRIVEVSSGKESFKAHGHVGEITDIAVVESEGDALAASASKDRMIQIFRRLDGKFELLQTLDDHIGSVSGICFSSDGKRLLSCSPDRSIILREAVTADVNGQEGTYFLLYKTINLKSTPSSIQMAGSGDSFLVSTIDKHIHKYSLDSGTKITAFKTADQEDGDAISLGSIVAVPLPSKTSDCLAGVANADKSIRVYTEEGTLIGLEYGHTEGLTGIALLTDPEDQARKSLVSVATDGTILLWSLCIADSPLGGVAQTDVGEGTPKANAFFSNGPPLRRVLSSSELMQLQGLRLDDGTAKRTGRSRSPLREASNGSTPFSSKRRTETSRKAVNRYEDRNNHSPTGRKKSTTDMSSRQPSPPASRSSKQSTANTRTLRRKSSYPVMGNNEAQKSISSIVRRRKSVSSETSSNSLKSMNHSSHQNSLRNASSQICQNIRSFRHHLATSRDVLPAENAKELERELTLTAKALAEKSARNEAVMAQLLDRYTEQLAEKLDERIKYRVLEGLREASPMPIGAGGRIEEEVESEALEDCSPTRAGSIGLM
ncbi:MAG: hypothetical protein M1831_003718 [Alyxoria varia]|nr:MAG: hypothetical protein M1831_003718 [Alyxoria varia]